MLSEQMLIQSGALGEEDTFIISRKLEIHRISPTAERTSRHRWKMHTALSMQIITPRHQCGAAPRRYAISHLMSKAKITCVYFGSKPACLTRAPCVITEYHSLQNAHRAMVWRGVLGDDWGIPTLALHTDVLATLEASQGQLDGFFSQLP